MPNYVDKLISHDGKNTAIVLQLSQYYKDEQGQFQRTSADQVNQTVNSLRQLLTDSDIDGRILLTGTPVIEETLTRLVFDGTNITGALAFSLTIGFLILFFRRLSGVVIPLLVINGALLSAMGFMVLNNVPWTLTFGTIPPIMIAIGVADSVHILAVFYKNYAQSGDKRQAIIDAIQHSAPAVLLTSLTTAAGFLSFSTAELASIKDLGIYAAIAVSFALLFTVTLIPALLAQFKIKQRSGNIKTMVSVEAFTQSCVTFSTRYPKVITGTAVVVLIAGIANAVNLQFSDDVISTFPDTEIARQDLLRFDDLYNGSGNLEVIIDSGAKRGIVDTEFLQKLQLIDNLFSNTTIEGVQFSNSYSVLNILKENA